MFRAVVVGVLLGACGIDAPPSDEPPPGEPPPGEEPAPVAVTLSGLQPGWHVTTARLTGDAAPAEATIVADGTAITLTGTNTDVFFTTITDATGALVEAHAMTAPCTLASARRRDVPGEYATIQLAINAASPGDTVRVAPGTYHESIAMRRGICLLGSGAKRTILDAQGQGRALVDLSDAPGSIVAGFTMRGTAPKVGCANEDPFTCSTNWYTAAIYINGAWDSPVEQAPPIIVNNVFAENYIGVLLGHHGPALVRNNVFLDNRNGLVANHFQSRALVANNVFVGSSELAIGNQAAYLDIIDNVIAESAIGIRFQYIQTGYIRCNVFYNNGANQEDVAIRPPRFAIGSDGNVELDPLFLDGSYRLADASPAKGHGCHGASVLQPASGGTVLPDIGVHGGPLASWVDL